MAIIQLDLRHDTRALVALDLLQGVRQVHKFGRSDSVGTTEAVIAAGSSSPFLAAASAVRVRAGGNAADTAGGAGARTLTISGLDGSMMEASETVALAGASASAATTTLFFRVFRAFVGEAGTYATPYNTGDIVVETTGGVELATVKAARAQTQIAFYTVPAGYTALLLAVAVRVGGTKTCTFRMYQRRDAGTVTAPVQARRLVQEWPGVSGAITDEHATWEAFPAGTDLIMTGEAPVGSTSADAEFELLLIETG